MLHFSVWELTEKYCSKPALKSPIKDRCRTVFIANFEYVLAVERHWSFTVILLSCRKDVLKR